MFRKRFILPLCLILAVSLWGCGMPKVRVRLKTKSSPSQAASADSELSKIKPDNIQGEDSSDKPSGPSKDTTSSAGTDSSEKSDTDSKKNSESDSTTDSSAKPTPADATTPTVEKKVVFDAENLVISSVAFKNSTKEDQELSVSIENKNDYTVKVRCLGVLLNDTLSVSCFDDTTVWAGKKATLKIRIDKKFSSSYGVEPIGDIKLKFRVEDTEYNTLFTTDFVDIPTSLYDQMNTDVHLDGAIDLYSGEGIEITGLFVEKFGVSNDCGVLMLVNNQTGRDINLDCRDAAVNDTMVSSLWDYNSTVYSGKYAVVFLCIEDFIAEESGIDLSDVSKIEFSLTGIDSSTYDRLFVTDPIVMVKAS